jgi:hypothetical protein
MRNFPQNGRRNADIVARNYQKWTRFQSDEMKRPLVPFLGLARQATKPMTHGNIHDNRITVVMIGLDVKLWDLVLTYVF